MRRLKSTIRHRRKIIEFKLYETLAAYENYVKSLIETAVAIDVVS